MFKRSKDIYHRIKNGVPGQRFTDLYRHGQEKNTTLWVLIYAVSGIVLVLMGLVLSLPGIPGPGLILALVGLSLLAIGSRYVSSFLDMCEMKMRNYFGLGVGRDSSDRNAAEAKETSRSKVQDES